MIKEPKEILNDICLNLYRKSFNNLNVYELEDLAFKSNII